MALPIDELTEPIAEDQLKETVYNVLAAVGVNARAWKSGGVARTIIAALCQIIAGFTILLAFGIKAAFLESSTGAWLTLLARYLYAVERILATFASGTVTVTNSSVASYDEPADTLLVLNTATGKSYRITEQLVIGPGESVDVDCQAVEVGSASTATSGQIDDFVTPLIGLSVTNAEALIGTEEETDADLRVRCLESLGALSPLGAAAAYSYFAKSAKLDGVAIGVNRVQVVKTSLTGEVTVFVSTPSGDLTTEQLEAVDADIKAYAVPACITETTANATGVPAPVLYTAYLDGESKKTPAEVKAKINAALTAYGAAYPIGGRTLDGTDYFLFRDKILGVIFGADPDIFEADLITPIADIELSPGDRAALTISGSSAVTPVVQ